MAIEMLLNNLSNLDNEIISDTSKLIEIKKITEKLSLSNNLEYDIYSKKYMQKYNLNINELNKNINIYSKYYLDN